MKHIILRSLLITVVALLIFQDSDAQRGRYNNHHYYHYSPYRSRTIVHFSAPRVIIPFGGISYHYSSGYYYRPYGRYYRSVFPPVGIHISILPRGYRRVYVGQSPYYYYDGTYYRHNKDKNYYEVIDAPLGASVPELPEEAKVVVINDQKYYELEGTYYKEEIRDNNEIWYTVVGKDGKLNTEEDNNVIESGPQVGDIVDELPDGCKTVVLNDTEYYVSPDGVYYQEEMQQNTRKYKVVGK
jgi:Family of unknown function (DUF6515)